MPTGRSPAVAKRNAKIKKKYAAGVTPHKLAEQFGLSRQKIHVIVSDPNSHIPTQRAARQYVRPLAKLPKRYAGIQHGSEAGYRAELKAKLTPCEDCQAAHAIAVDEWRKGRT